MEKQTKAGNEYSQTRKQAKYILLAKVFLVEFVKILVQKYVFKRVSRGSPGISIFYQLNIPWEVALPQPYQGNAPARAGQEITSSSMFSLSDAKLKSSTTPTILRRALSFCVFS